PGGPARITNIVPQEKGFELELDGLECADRIFTRSTQVPQRFILHPRDVDRSEVSRARQAGQFERISAVSFYPISGFFGDERRGDDPAAIAFLGEVAVEPVATGARFIDKDKLWAFRLHLANEFINVTLARPDGTEGDDLGMVFLGHVSNGYRL